MSADKTPKLGRLDTEYTPWCIVNPDVKAALIAEIEKALPALLKKAMAAVKKKTVVSVPKAKRQRLPNGAPKRAILKAIRAFPETGATRQQIQSIAPNFLHGAQLGDNTLKRWLFVLKRDGEIDHINGRWFWQPDGATYHTRTRDNGRAEDDYQEKDNV